MSGRLSKALSRVSSELEELLYKISLEITDLHRGVATGANVGGTVFAQALQDVQQDVDEVEEKMGVVEALTVDNTPMDELLGYGVQLYEQHMQDLGALEQYLEQFGYEPTYDEPAPADPLTATDEVLEETRGFSDCSDAFLDTSELSPLSYHSPLQPITNLEHRSQPAAADTAAKPAVGIVQQQQQLKQQMARCSLGSSVTSGSVRTPDCLAAADNGGDAAASRSTSSISTPPLLHGPLPSPLLLPHGGEAAAAELLQLEEGVQEQAADAPGQPLPSPMLFPASPWAAAAPSDAGTAVAAVFPPEAGRGAAGTPLLSAARGALCFASPAVPEQGLEPVAEGSPAPQLVPAVAGVPFTPPDGACGSWSGAQEAQPESEGEEEERQAGPSEDDSPIQGIVCRPPLPPQPQPDLPGSLTPTMSEMIFRIAGSSSTYKPKSTIKKNRAQALPWDEDHPVRQAAVKKPPPPSIASAPPPAAGAAAAVAAADFAALPLFCRSQLTLQELNAALKQIAAATVVAAPSEAISRAFTPQDLACYGFRGKEKAIINCLVKLSRIRLSLGDAHTGVCYRLA